LSNKIKAILIILAGVILVGVGVFASYLLIQRFQAQQAPAVVQEEIIKTDVVVVTRDLFLGDTLTEADLEITSVPVEVVPRNAVTAVEDAVGKFIIFANFEKEIEAEEAVNPVTGEEQEPETRTFTLDSFQRINVTALVVDIIEEEQGGGGAELLPGQTAEGDPVQNVNVRAYLLALNPQDALILKHMKDTGAVFDIVLRAPTSTLEFELTEEFIIEFYGLDILP
jgi:hypothetical protein